MCSVPIRWLSLLGFFTALLFPAISSLDAQVREDDLVIWLDFNELNGSTVTDLAGNGLDGVTAGGPALEDGQYGKALNFNGNGQKVTVGYDVQLDVPQYTAAIWFKSVKSNDGWVGVFGRPGRHYNFWAGDSQKDNWFVHHRYRDGTNTNNGAEDAGSFPHGEWTHVVLTNDGDTSVTYVNGVSRTTGNVGTLTYTTNPLYIGATPDNGNGNWYEGLIDDFRLYGVALTAEEVAKAYNGGKGDFDRLPVVTLVGDVYVRVPIGGAYTESGATATDPEDGDLDTVRIAYKGPQIAPEELATDTHEGLKL
ncbi:MAG: LamG domain-containing protein, partial [Opitutales bacterium]|nr:LamG domain-containing protein [Opitutales bacterium]